MDFNTRLQKWARYIKQVATKSARGWVFSAQEDIEQLLTIALWRCHTKYPNLDDARFHKAYSMSVQNQLATLFRRSRHKHQLDEVSLETARQVQPRGGRRVNASLPFASDEMVSDDVSAEFYRARLREIVDSISPQGLHRVLRKMEIQPRTRRSSIDRHAEALRDRAAAEEVRELVRGE